MSYLSKFADFALPHLGARVVGDPVRFSKRFLALETRVPGLSRGVVYVILSAIAVLIQCRLVADRQTDGRTDGHTTTANTALA